MTRQKKEVTNVGGPVGAPRVCVSRSYRPRNRNLSIRIRRRVSVMKRVIALIDSVVLHRHAKALECESDGFFVVDAKVVGRNSERRSKGFSAPDTVLRIKKHELTICNAAHGIQYVTLKFMSRY